MSGNLLHSHISGQGDTIVLLHGYLSSGQYFKRLQKRLTVDHRVIALDLLGFGQSPKPKVDYTYSDHMVAIRATLQHLGITHYALLGHSMGALIALRYATQHPTDVRKILLFNPPLFTDREQMAATHLSTGRRYRILLYSRGKRLYWMTLRLVPRRYSRRRKPINFTDMISMNRHAREGSYHHVIGGATPFDDLRVVTMPTLLAVGLHDRDIYLDNLQGRTFPQHVTISKIDADHHPIVRKLDMTESLIRSYLLE